MADKDDDSFNYLPSELPASVAQLLNEKYAGYKLLEVELDPVSKLLEVDVLLLRMQKKNMPAMSWMMRKLKRWLLLQAPIIS